jgi:hypothetical protein
MVGSLAHDLGSLVADDQTLAMVFGTRTRITILKKRTLPILFGSIIAMRGNGRKGDAEKRQIRGYVVGG